MKNKILSILTVLVLIVAVFATSVTAASGVTAYFATYDTYVNGEKINKEDVLVYNSETYVKVPALQDYGIGRDWNEVARIASFNVPNPVESTEMKVSDMKELVKNSVRFYKRNNNGSTNFSQFQFNGTWVSKDTILATRYKIVNGRKTAIDYNQLVALDSNNRKITLKRLPISTDARLVLLQTTGAITNNFAKMATVEPKQGDNVVICGSVNQNPNYFNTDIFWDKEDYDLFDAGRKDYYRTLNSSEYSTIGSPLYNDKGHLIGITCGRDSLDSNNPIAVNGGNGASIIGGSDRGYLLSITMKDINAFAPMTSAEN